MDTLLLHTVEGTNLLSRPPTLYCRLCTSYAAKRWAALISDKRCTGRAKHTGRLNRLWEGKHPQTGEPL